MTSLCDVKMTSTIDDVDPVLTSLKNILSRLEEQERLFQHRKKQLRLVASARRDRMFSAPELLESDDDEEEDVEGSSPLSSRSWRPYTGRSRSPWRDLNTMGDHLKPRTSLEGPVMHLKPKQSVEGPTMHKKAISSTEGPENHLRPKLSKEGPSMRSGSSLKRNSMVHERPRRINGLSKSIDRAVIREEDFNSSKSDPTSKLSQSVDGRISNGTVKARAPSPKRKQAPPPPPLPSTSPPSPKQVCRTDVANPDHSGWLLDQLKGEKVWCVVVDMLFCVFVSDSANQSRDVIFLPGCKVRSLVFNSAKRDSWSKDSETNKTITGVDKYQFYIENVSVRRKYLFGVKTKSELDEWVDMLTRACDVAVFDTCVSQSRDSDGWDSCDDSVFPPSSYHPSPTRSRRMSMISMSLRDKDINDNKSEALVDFRRRLRKESDEPKCAPVKGLHNMESAQKPKKSRSFLAIRSFGSLDSLFKRKRSKSAERAAQSDNHSFDETKSLHYPDSDGSDTPSLSRPTSTQSFLSRSWDSGKSSNGLGSSIRRRASDLKDKMFGGGKRSDSLRSPGLRLKDLTDVRISGHLQYKVMMKWIKVWCVVSRGCFYGFKTRGGEDTPLLAVVLTQSTVSYVTEPEKRNKKLYVFRLCQPHCKSIYLCTQEESDLSRWLQVLQMEACRIQADDTLAKESTTDCNHSVDSALSVMSMASSHTDITENFNIFNNNLVLNSTTHSQDYPAGSYDYTGSDVTGRLDSTESADDWDNSSQSSTSDQVPYPRANDHTPKHDPSVSYLWSKDKGYLLQVIRAKLRRNRRSQGDTEGDLYDREIQRGTGGSMLVIEDEADKIRRGPLDAKAGRSKSLADLPCHRMDVAGVEDRFESRGARARPRPLAVKKLPAQDLQSPTLSGYIERKGFNGQWTRYWYVIKGSYLYCYLTPEDQVTVDITYLHGYQVTSLIDQFRGKRFVIFLSHTNYIPLYLSIESRDQMEAWSDALQEAAQKPEIDLPEPEVDQSGKDEKCESQLTIKQKLLAEVLRQKEELEKKQAARRMAAQKSTSSAQTPGKDLGDVHISTVTRLKQRRLSTQIKMEAIQRQIGDPPKNGQKKSLFKIGKKKSQEEKNPHLVEQLKELSTTLKEIDINLNQEGVHTNNNVASSTVGFHKVPTEVELKKGDSFDEDPAVQRSNSLKASVQRLAHRTFAKAGWRKNSRKSQSLHFDEYQPDDTEYTLSQSQEMIDLTQHSADIISSISFSSSAELTSLASSSDFSQYGSQDPESPLSGRSTPASPYSPRSPCSPSSPRTTFPLSPPSLRTSPRDRGLSAARAEMMTRSLSVGPTMSTQSMTSSCEGEPSSPRREINPSLMAEIDAFEEFTKQALARHSALTSH